MLENDLYLWHCDIVQSGDVILYDSQYLSYPIPHNHKVRYTRMTIVIKSRDGNILSSENYPEMKSAVVANKENLRNADLSDVDLSNTDLSDAELAESDLRNADLSSADLSHANLFGADLSHANLSNANLFHA